MRGRRSVPASDVELSTPSLISPSNLPSAHRLLNPRIHGDSPAPRPSRLSLLLDELLRAIRLEGNARADCTPKRSVPPFGRRERCATDSPLAFQPPCHDDQVRESVRAPAARKRGLTESSFQATSTDSRGFSELVSFEGVGFMGSRTDRVLPSQFLVSWRSQQVVARGTRTDLLPSSP